MNPPRILSPSFCINLLVLDGLFALSSRPPLLQGLAGPPEEVGRSPAEIPSTDRDTDMEAGTEMDLESYQVTLEEVLTWLLSAEDALQIQDEVSDDVEEVKDQFHTHEVLKLQFYSEHYVMCKNVCL